MMKCAKISLQDDRLVISCSLIVYQLSCDTNKMDTLLENIQCFTMQEITIILKLS